MPRLRVILPIGEKIFGWTVIAKAERLSKYVIRPYLCRCECGFETTLDARRLIDGYTKRCRTCANKIVNKNARDKRHLARIGKRYGKWTVIQLAGIIPRKGEVRPVYRCRCECGFEIIPKSIQTIGTRPPKCFQCDSFTNSRRILKKKDYSGFIETHRIAESLPNYFIQSEPIKSVPKKKTHDVFPNEVAIDGEYAMTGLLMGWKKKR